MTGRQVLDRAMGLLGYGTTAALSGPSELLQRSLAVVNQIYSDLFYAENRDAGESQGLRRRNALTGEESGTAGKIGSGGEFVPLIDLMDEIRLSRRAASDVMPYGVAMLLAQSESDGDSQQLFAALYNRKRLSLSYTDKVRDTRY